MHDLSVHAARHFGLSLESPVLVPGCLGTVVPGKIPRARSVVKIDLT